jgi:hypothetical protein
METSEVRVGDLRIGSRNIPFIVVDLGPASEFARILIAGESHTVRVEILENNSVLLSRGH